MLVPYRAVVALLGSAAYLRRRWNAAPKNMAVELQRASAALAACYASPILPLSSGGGGADALSDDKQHGFLHLPHAIAVTALRAFGKEQEEDKETLRRQEEEDEEEANKLEALRRGLPRCATVVCTKRFAHRRGVQRGVVKFVRQLLKDHDAFEVVPRPWMIRRLRRITDLMGTAQSAVAPIFLWGFLGLPGGVRRQVCAPGREGVAYSWFEPTDRRSDNATLVYFHGGGFVIGSRRTNGEMVGRIAEATRCRTLLVEYRRLPEARFPDALVDALYGVELALAEPGVTPEVLVIGGDSAGGALAVACLLFLRQKAKIVPAAALLLSPLVDLEEQSFGSYFFADSYVSETSELGDILPPRTVTASRAALREMYTPAKTPRAHRALVSPRAASMRQLRSLRRTPLLVHAGGSEVLRDSIIYFGRRAEKAGVPVHLRLYQGEVHAFHAFSFSPGWPLARIDLREFVDTALADRAKTTSRSRRRHTRLNTTTPL